VSDRPRQTADVLGANDYVQGFTSGIIDTRIGSATLVVLRCTMLCKSSLASETADRAVQVLLEDLADFGRKSRNLLAPWRSLTGPASVQEIVLVTLSVILSQTEYDQSRVIDVIRQVQLDAGKYIKKVSGESESY